jgi:hypothetical protein
VLCGGTAVLGGAVASQAAVPSNACVQFGPSEPVQQAFDVKLRKLPEEIW